MFVAHICKFGPDTCLLSQDPLTEYVFFCYDVYFTKPQKKKKKE